MASETLHKLDIFETLTAIDERNFSFLDDLTDDRRKGFKPLVVMKWLSAVNARDDDLHLHRVNRVVNVDFFTISDFPDIQYRLMASCGSGKRTRHAWVGFPPGRDANAALTFLERIYPGANDFEMQMILDKYTLEEFSALVDECALPQKEVDEVLSAYSSLYKIEAESGPGTVKNKKKKSEV